MSYFKQLAKKESRSLLIITDTNGYVFGGYASTSWKPTSTFYGTGDSFVFTLEPKRHLYKWSGKNNFIQIGTETSLSMGGGGKAAFYLDEFLKDGSSGACKTFECPRMASGDTFEALHVELWAFRLKN